MILARADRKIPQELLDKISAFCDVERSAVIPALTVNSIYDVPLNFQKYGIAQIIGNHLGMGDLKPNMSDWEKGHDRHELSSNKNPIPIALVGKYTHLDDAYLSVIESVKSAAVNLEEKAEIVWIDSEKLEKPKKESSKEEIDERLSEWKKLERCKGIVVPGGFGLRGIEGKIAAAHYARTKKVPYLGLCLGSQILAIEFARSKLKDNQITSEEFDEESKLSKTKYLVHFLPDQNKSRAKGGTLRLGAYICKLKKGTKAYKAYDLCNAIGPEDTISERHRHRYEFNNAYRKKLEDNGLVFSGEWTERNLMEIVEVSDHPFMLGSQFHPEFKSRPHRPHPLFFAFVESIVRK
jgi:CTP synthase